MKPQEVLHEISVMVYRNTDDFEMRISKDCYKGIITALEKQIPEKPTPQVVKGGKRLIGNGWWCNGTTVYRCPNCNEFISRTYDYCYKCGQALDWSDTE